MNNPSHTSIKARPDSKMSRRIVNPDKWMWFWIGERNRPKAIRLNKATTGQRQALKKSANAKRRRQDRINFDRNI